MADSLSSKQNSSRSQKAPDKRLSLRWNFLAALLVTSLSFIFSPSSVTPGRVRAEGPCTKPPNPALLPIPEGALVATCFSDFNIPGGGGGINLNGFVVGIVDVRNPAANGAVKGLNWCPDMYHNDNSVANKWTAANLGQVYGVTLDDAANPNIYVTATTIYGYVTFKPGGTGGEVYKLDGTNGNISLFGGASLPNTGEGLGNICYDRGYNNGPKQFFVSNFADGRIYRLSLNGTVLSTFDHATGTITNNGNPEPNDAVGFAPLGERVWGVQVYKGRLYYSIWARDQGRQTPPPGKDNEIWSIALDASGNFTGSPQIEISYTPVNSNLNFSNPVSDIAFSPSGTMFLAEHSQLSDTTPNAHLSRVLEYQFNGAVWVPTGRNFSVGNYANNTNSAGGIDVDCQGDVWGTGDALVYDTLKRPTVLPPDPNGLYVYGLQQTPAAGNTSGSTIADFNLPTYVGLSSYYVDLNGNPNTPTDKRGIGSLEIYKKTCGQQSMACAEVKAEGISCKPDGKGSFSYTFTVKNNTGTPVHSVLLTPTTGSSVTFSNQQITFASPLQSGNTSAPQTVTIGNVKPGQDICFTVTLMSKEGPCCTIKVCLTLPFCCAQILKESVAPVKGAPGTYTYTFTIQNQSNNPAEHLYLYPPPGVTMTPSYFALSPALAIGNTFTGTVTISGAKPGTQLCFSLSLHTSEMKECCTVDICIKLGDAPKNAAIERRNNLNKTAMRRMRRPQRRLLSSTMRRPIEYG